MDKESVLIFGLERGFGEVKWITCPICWNTMKVTQWENGLHEEECGICLRIVREMKKAA